MKYAKKIPPTDVELSKKLLSYGWRKIKEPSSLVQATLISMPFAFLGGAVILLIVFWLSPALFDVINSDFKFSFRIDIIGIFYILVILVYILLHEFLHALLIPDVFKSDKTVWGLRGAFGFVFTTEKIKKGRFILITVMPFIVLSVIMPFVLFGFGLLNWYTVLVCLINAMGSCVDLLSLCLILIQVPNGSNIINNGFETYYK